MGNHLFVKVQVFCRKFLVFLNHNLKFFDGKLRRVSARRVNLRRKVFYKYKTIASVSRVLSLVLCQSWLQKH